MNKRRAARVSAIFFSIMLLLTLCSRTIYRSTLPKVSAERPSGGTLKYAYDIDEFNIVADKTAYEYIPFPLDRQLTVERAWVKPGDYVRKGDKLISFCAPEGEYLLALARSELSSAEEACLKWDADMADARARLEQKLNDAATPDELSSARRELELLQAGLMDGMSARDVRERFERTRAAHEYMEALSHDGWTLKAIMEGTVCSVLVNEGGAYAGVSPICRIADPSQRLYLSMRLEGAPDAGRGDWNVKAYITVNAQTAQAEVISIDGESVLAALPDGALASEVVMARVSLVSPYKQMLVDNSAIYGDNVFLLSAEVGEWGQKIYVARETTITKGGSDAINTVINDGLRAGDRVIVHSTAQLADRQQVILDSYD